MYTPEYRSQALSPEDVQILPGRAVLEFGTAWCPICQGAQADIREVLEDLADVPHIKIEDGPGRRLGRSFKVKLWPTLIFLQDGVEISRVVRPRDAKEIRKGLEAIDGAP